MYRPWGDLDWINSKLGIDRWSFIGCLSHEDRSLAAFNKTKQLCNNSHFAVIFDQDPIDFDQERASLSSRAKEAVHSGADQNNIRPFKLFSTLDQKSEFLETAMKGSENVILDVTSFPKRWFFPLVRFLTKDQRLSNIVLTYSLAEKYADVGSFNPERVGYIPTFDGAALGRGITRDIAFVGVGFQSQSVVQLFNDERPSKISLLFPFPPGPPGIKRNWEFIAQTESKIGRANDDNRLAVNKIEHMQIAAGDLSGNFDALAAVSDNGAKSCLLAPYGPKPVSLAMCLFALSVEKAFGKRSPVYYAQPKRYALDYTTGVACHSDDPIVNAYPIRLSGRDLFQLENR